MSQPVKIPRSAYEVPLLQSLAEMGGSVAPGVELYQRVAEKMGFAPDQEMEYDLVHAREKWVYTLQWVRHTLVKSGDMDGSTRGTWAITQQGQTRLGERSL